jgi:hypothetical protein
VYEDVTDVKDSGDENSDIINKGVSIQADTSPTFLGVPSPSLSNKPSVIRKDKKESTETYDQAIKKVLKSIDKDSKDDEYVYFGKR